MLAELAAVRDIFDADEDDAQHDLDVLPLLLL